MKQVTFLGMFGDENSEDVDDSTTLNWSWC